MKFILFILRHPRGLCGPSKFFDLLGPRGPHRMHCGREFLLPVSVDSVRLWRVENDPVDVELRGPWDPGAPGAHYMGPWARLYYRELQA